MESSVENANKSNKSDEEEPPPEDQENLEWMVIKFSCWYTLVYDVQGFEMQVEYVKVEVEQIQTTPLCTDTEYK